MNPDEPNQDHNDPAMADDAAAFLRYLKSPAYEARNQFVTDVSGLPELGLWQLSLCQAADLIAADMWLAGDIKTEVAEAEPDTIARDDPRLLEAIAAERGLLLVRLVESILRNSLEPSQIRRDLLTGEIDPESTYVEYGTLCDWMKEFEYEPGDWMSEYSDAEASVFNDLADALFDIRNLHVQIRSGDEIAIQARRRVLAFVGPDDDPVHAAATAQELREIIKGYSAEVAHLRRELGNRPTASDGLLRPKSRNTLYRLIVALCAAARINPGERGAAIAIEALTQRAGLHVGDDTIRKILSELPERDSG
jgi:hypothetical protein